MIFNKVVTAQYFLWYVVLFPLCLINNELARDKVTHLPIIVGVWSFGQAYWGYFAHNFEHYFADYIMHIQIANYLFFIINLGVMLYTVKLQRLHATRELVDEKEKDE